MAEPKVRFKRDDGISYPPYSAKTLGDCFEERNQRASGSEELLAVTQARGVILQSETDKRNVSSSDKSNYKVVCVGDIAYNSMRMWQGAEGVSAYNGIVSPAYTIISPRHIDINAYYFEKYFKTYKLLKIFERNSQGITSDTWNLKYPAFSRIKVNVPCAEEQKKVADFLSSVDEIIAASEEEVANLERQKKAVMKKIFSQDVRFKRADGSDFPEWDDIRFGDVFTEIVRKTSDTEMYPLYSLTIEDGVTEKTERYERGYLVKKAEDNYKIVPPNAFVYNPMNLRFGALAPNHTNKEVSVSQYYNVFSLKDNTVLGFWESYLVTDDMLKYYFSIATGSLVEKLRVHYSSFVNIIKLLPCLEEQRLIADFLSDFDEAIAAAKKELELWKELKKGLLQQMFV